MVPPLGLRNPTREGEGEEERGKEGGGRERKRGGRQEGREREGGERDVERVRRRGLLSPLSSSIA